MNKNREYQKLEYLKLVELKNDLSFVIATETDISMISSGLLFLRGQLYNYDEGLAVKLNNKTEICYHADENFYEEVDENGYYID